MSEYELPETDLSKYSGREVLPSYVECILVNSLVLAKKDVSLVSSKYHLPEEDVNKILTKHLLMIDSLSSNKSQLDISNEIIDQFLEIAKDQVDEIRKIQESGKDKLLRSTHLYTLDTIMGKIINIYERNIKNREHTIDMLNSAIYKSKLTEVTEGMNTSEEDIGDKNRNTFIAQLASVLNPPKATRTKKTMVKCTETGVIYESMAEAANSINGNSGAIGHAIKHGTCAGGYHWERVDKTKDEV